MREHFNKQQELLYRSYRASLDNVTGAILQVCSMISILFALGYAIARADILFATSNWVVGFILPTAIAGIIYFLLGVALISIISDRKYKDYKSRLKEISDGVDNKPRSDARNLIIHGRDELLPNNKRMVAMN